MTIPVNVVTGFLGSGKTTLLNAILVRPEFADAAVIVNEFGSVGLDHVLMEEVEEGILLLESGCICCTIRSDLKETIRSLYDRAAAGVIPRFNRLLIETTGLADPAPIVSTIAAEPVIRNHFHLGNIVCTVDAVVGAETLDNQDESVKQASIADRILLTKTDLADEVTIDALERRLGRLNHAAGITRSTGSGFDAALLFGEDLNEAGNREREVKRWLSRVPEDDDHDHSAHGDETRSFVVDYATPIDWTAFGVWLTALLHVHGERILRVKGLLNVRESEMPVAIHGVQHVVHPPMHLNHWPDNDRTSRIVFITRGIDERAIRRSLATFVDMAARLDGAAAAA
ncbi:MAG: GTP-binding protein [Hyphomicrobiales bacterium]|nr:GTP-binding protein [Hyphomicrobiales bacterium]